MTASSTFDVIFVGAGHNALVAASYLAREGRSVCLLDQRPTPGGWVRSEELTLPGFIHDTFSACHPLFVGGPVFAELGTELAEHGLRYVQGEVSAGASLPDGRSAVISTDPDALQAELDRLGERQAWTELMADVSPHLSLVPLLGMDLDSPEATGLLKGLCRQAGSSLPFAALLHGSGRDVLGDRFSSEELIMALLPWLLHLGIGPTDAGGALWAALLMTMLPAGTPAPVGGSGRLVEALTGLVSAYGGEIRTGVDVDAVVTAGGRATGVRTTQGEQLTATQAVIASTTPDQLYGRLLRDAPGIPESTRAQARRYRYRRGCFQINLALSARPRFADSRLDGGGGINVGRGLTELLTSVRQAEVGLLPGYPSMSWHEPTAVDPTRAPAGQAVVRLQVLDVPLHPTGDAAEDITLDGGWTAPVAERFADRVIAEAAQHISGLEQLVLARHILSPADLARTNPNAGPGDHASGHNALSQAFTQRPIPAHRGGYATAVTGLYLIGAASWPGPGVSGSSGRAVARRLLNRPDSTQTPRNQPPTRTMGSRSVDRTAVTFPSGGASCAGWLYCPADADGNIPCVVMAHGLSLTRHDGLVAYAQALAEAGAAVLVYDHRYLGDSGGQPRQLVRMSAQLHDRRCAIAYARGLHGIDADKIVVWGYSISGGTAVKAAASDPRVAGAILLCPFLDGRARAITDLTTDPGNVAWLFAQAIKDMAGSHSLVPATAPPGGHGVLTLRGEADGFKSMIDADSPWRNEVAAGPFATAAFYRPVTKARKLACPVLVQLCQRDISSPSRPIQNLAQRAPRAELKRYDLDHFQPFYGNNPAGIAADQADWLKRTVLNG